MKRNPDPLNQTEDRPHRENLYPEGGLARGRSLPGETPRKKPMKTSWQDIPQFPRASYEIDVAWPYLETTLNFFRDMGADFDPDFQREHVWTEEQRVRWLEYVLRGGEISRTLIFACSDWNSSGRNAAPGYFLALADGKQRLETVQRFLRGEIRIFRGAVLLGGKTAPPEGLAFEEFGGAFRSMLYGFRFRVVETPTRLDVLNLYLSINTGGTAHSPAEIARVTAMRDAELRILSEGPGTP